jgi:hypothetical protein
MSPAPRPERSGPATRPERSSTVAEDLANILSAVVDQVRGLSDGEIRALVAGDAEFRLVPRKATRRAAVAPAPVPPTPANSAAREAPATATATIDPDEVRSALAGYASEPEAVAYLQGLKLNPAAAKSLASGLGLRLPARPSVTAINAEIVRVLVRGRLNAATVQGL